ncbi:MAG TPA: chemotaxis protein CheW [Blastocatellia bacterium]|nr:chemotaxis protein CheW [Blastocatellia bacterium]
MTSFLEGLKAIHLGSPDAEKEEAAVNHVSVLLFRIGGEPYAIGVESTEGVVDCPRISPLPSPPDGIVGVASIRGKITVVMDLSLGSAQPEDRRRLILLRGDAQLGLLADRVEGVLSLTPRQVRSSGTRRQDAQSEASAGSELWPSQNYFKSEGREVPIIDTSRLAEV